MKISRNLFKLVVKKITRKIVEELTKVVLKHISELTSIAATERLIEKAKNYKSQVQSLTGVPPDAHKIIKGLM